MAFPTLKATMDLSASGAPGSDDEDSFVVLESSPSMSEHLSYESASAEVLPTFGTNKVREMQNLLKVEISEMNESKVLPEIPLAASTGEAVARSDSPASKITLSPDSSYEEIQKHVEELIRENETLKNTITQNNISMKSQYSRFLTYKDEVVQVMKSYKEKFNEAKNLIDKYKEENAKLASDIEMYVDIKKLHEEEIINLKDKIKQENSENVDKPDSKVMGELQTELAQKNLKIAELVAEKEKNESEIQNLKSSYEVSEKQLELTRNSHETGIAEKKALTAKLKDLHKCEKEIQLYQQNIEQLTQRLMTTSKLEEHLQTKQQEYNVLQFDISALKKELNKLKNENDTLKDKFNNVSTQSNEMVQSAQIASNLQLTLKEGEIADLRQELEKSRVTESTQQAKIAQLKTSLKELKDKLNPLPQEDYRLLLQQLSIAQQTITALETQREKTAEEIERLRKLIQESDNDEIFALKEQLTLYKNDFDAEKESKTALKIEKDQIAEDLQNVQTRNKQLQNEVETLRARMQPNAEGYTCPKCSFKFNSYQSLENHVHRCLDLDGFP